MYKNKVYRKGKEENCVNASKCVDEGHRRTLPKLISTGSTSSLSPRPIRASWADNTQTHVYLLRNSCVCLAIWTMAAGDHRQRPRARGVVLPGVDFCARCSGLLPFAREPTFRASWCVVIAVCSTWPLSAIPREITLFAGLMHFRATLHTLVYSTTPILIAHHPREYQD